MHGTWWPQYRNLEPPYQSDYQLVEQLWLTKVILRQRIIYNNGLNSVPNDFWKIKNDARTSKNNFSNKEVYIFHLNCQNSK